MRRPIPQITRDKQRRASDPSVSAWVSAHAGSGKTHVLSQRVVRLLLAGAPPSRILCLTYTKAAAANMATRVFDILASWTAFDDEALTRAIEETGAPTPSAHERDFARRLFARVVETPGGLKIQTIHAFCEKLLHEFPFEANVPAGFRVMDDMERAELLQSAGARALARAVAERSGLHDALTIVAGETGGDGFDRLCAELLEHRDALRPTDDPDDHARQLRARLGLAPGDTLRSVEDEMIDGGVPPSHWTALAQRLRAGGKNDNKLAEQLVRAVALAPAPACLDAYLDVFFTGKGEARGLGAQKIISKPLRDQDPGLLGRLEQERDRLAALIEKRKAAAVAERSLALAVVGDAIVGEYERAKSNRGLFDFDDLIDRVQELLRRSRPSWVLYKLDSQIDHILLDEAQDTSAAQWRILESIVEEFYAGAGARRLARTFFAVGDEKQSIFSFQGAAPEKFDEMRRAFENRFRAAGKPFMPVPLTLSFRSAPEILQAADEIFAADGNARGLTFDAGEPPPRHEALKADVRGLVEIWDLIGAQSVDVPTDWRLPLDVKDESDPAARLARKIARKIKALLAPDGGECVESNGVLRPVEAGDILVLVRKRDAFFEAVIRALKAEHVAVAGADRLQLMDHIAVMDLVALGRAALLPRDDLTLATLLKSPLVGLTDDDLIEIAPNREGALLDALALSARESHKTAAGKIAQWSRDAAALSPFDFYSRVLGVGRGREKLVARLGLEAHDAIDEFLRLALVFEREQAPSLTSFLAGIETLDISIKRDVEARGAAVRVMTVHAAKGLEAKIAFLPDTCGAPSGRHDPKLFALSERGEEAVLAWSRNRDSDPAAISQARERLREAARDEHQRLLYVALTRAEERLYIAGFHGAKGPQSGCWYETIRNALEPSCASFPDPEDPDHRLLRRGEAPARADLARAAPRVERAEIPLFARTPAPRERQPAPPLRPSNALAGADALAPLGGGLAPTRRDAERLLVGRLTHALLQHLPQVAPDRRLDAARRLLAARAGALEESRREELAQAAIAVIGDAALAPLFGPDSAAEVDIVGRLATPRGELAISGRIDRLAETERHVFVADFKTGRPPGEIGPEHLRQLALYREAVAALYPAKRVRCVLIFTRGATAIEPGDAALDEALRRIVEAA